MEDHPPKIHGNLLLGIAPLSSLLRCGPWGRPSAWSTGTGGTQLLRFPRQRGSLRFWFSRNMARLDNMNHGIATSSWDKNDSSLKRVSKTLISMRRWENLPSSSEVLNRTTCIPSESLDLPKNCPGGGPGIPLSEWGARRGPGLKARMWNGVEIKHMLKITKWTWTWKYGSELSTTKMAGSQW